MKAAPLGWELRLGLILVLLAAALVRIAFAGAQPDRGRFWDERYGFQNVATVLLDGRWQPAHALYPSLSYLPQTAVLAASEGLHQATGIPAFGVVKDRQQRFFTPTAYWLSRGVCVLFGLWSLWLLFRLGRRVLDGPTALVATLLLAAFWRHVTASGEFKPDIVVVALTLLSALWSLEAVCRQTWRAFLLAGAGIGLVTAAKYNAAAVCLVLVVGVLVEAVRLGDRRGFRLLPKLAAAGATSVAVFGLLNPWPMRVWTGFRWQLGYYAHVAEGEGSGHASVLARELEFFLRHHGVVVAICAAVGVIGLTWLAIRSPRRRAEGDAPLDGREVLPLVAFTVGYPLLYAAVTRLFLSQNMLPVVPFTCLFAAWTLVAGWRWLAGFWQPLRSRPLRWALFLALAVASFRFPVGATYQAVVPTTTQRTAELLAARLQPVELRKAFYERREGPIHARSALHRLPIQPVEDLTAVAEAALDLADAEVFPADRLEGEGSDWYLRRISRAEVAQIHRVAPQRFATQGAELVMVEHLWTARGEPSSLTVGAVEPGEVGTRFRLPLPARAGEVLSVSIAVPQGGKGRLVQEVRLGERRLAVFETGGTEDGLALFVTERFRVEDGAERELALELSKARRPFRVRATLYRWEGGWS